MNTTKRVRPGICLAVFLFAFLACAVAAEPPAILLWPNGAPDAEKNSAASKASESKSQEESVRVNENGEHIVSGIHHPSITPYLPAKSMSTGAAVIVTPGGGYRELWMDHEGYRVAKWLSDRGVAAFVLKYRLAAGGPDLPPLQKTSTEIRRVPGAPHIARFAMCGFAYRC